MIATYVTPNVSSETLRALNYSPEMNRLLSAKNSEQLARLGDLVTIRKPGSSTFRAYDCAVGLGNNFLTQSDIFAAEPFGRIIRTDNISDLDSRCVEPNQILVAGVGTLGETELYGRAIISDERLFGKILSSDILVFESTCDLDTYLYLYAFLSTEIGVKLIRSTSAGTKLLRPRQDLLKRLPIPFPTKEVRKKIADIIRLAINQRESYAASVESARKCMQSLPEMQKAKEMCAARRARCILWNDSLPTMTGWTYASAGNASRYLQKQWKTSFEEVVEKNGVFRGGRYPRIPCKRPFGVDFLSQRDAFLIKPVPQRVVLSKNSGTDLSCSAGTLLLGGQGTLGEGEVFGRVVIVDSQLEKAMMTEHLLRIKVNPKLRNLAFAFLSTTVGLRLVRSCAVGTKLLSLRPDLIKALPFPEVSNETLKKINAFVETGTASRMTAALTEEKATKVIEEEVLPQWLE